MKWKGEMTVEFASKIKNVRIAPKVDADGEFREVQVTLAFTDRDNMIDFRTLVSGLAELGKGRVDVNLDRTRLERPKERA